MGRGYIYEIAGDADDVGAMDESDFYEDLSCLHVDYVKNLDKEEQESIRDMFADMLKLYGATVELVKKEDPDGFPYEDPDGFPKGVYAVSHIDNSFKKKYFAERYKKMKELTASITLEQFSSFSSDTSLYDIKHEMFREYEDVVSEAGYGWDTLDYFIRHADPEKTYYIGHVVYMH